ncbi:MAG: M3 family oligoendopeptidase [Spirosomataceae bacterium]
MTADLLAVHPPQRRFLPQGFEFKTWEDLKPYFEQLQNEEILDVEHLRDWFKSRSELESYLSENFAWRYIRMTCNTADQAAQQQYQQFVTEIQPHIAPYDDAFNKKAIENPAINLLSDKGFAITLRGMKRAIEIFREENIPLVTQVQQLSSQYQATVGAMTVEVNGEVKTLQQAAALLESPDRSVREDIYFKIQHRRIQEKDKLDDLFNQMLKLRHQMALNAGFANYRDYMFAAMGRFDYTPSDCFNFHTAVAETIKPELNEMAQERKTALAVAELRPWDKTVDPQNRPALRPFTDGNDLLQKTISCLSRLDPFLGNCLKVMKDLRRLDLESRIGKAPGGYNYPLEETGFPFIFMNAASQLRDVVTLLHESGHAVHSILTKDLMLNTFRQFPSEVAELASMSMELLTMDYWDAFLTNPDDLKRAKIKHLEDILETLPWVATVDKFQHWIYENPTHTTEERHTAWLSIYEQFADDVTDWSDLEAFKGWMWHKQLHIFELPFYYIEYGIAQLGAIGVWKNYKENPQKGLTGYINALKLGYTAPMSEIYAAAGVPFDFSKEHIANLVAFVKAELNLLKR